MEGKEVVGKEQEGAGSAPLHMGSRFAVSPATPGWFRVKKIIGRGVEGIEGSLVERGLTGQMCEEK